MCRPLLISIGVIAMSASAVLATPMRANTVASSATDIVLIHDTCHEEIVAHRAGAERHYHRKHQVTNLSFECRTYRAGDNRPGIVIQFGNRGQNNNNNNQNNGGIGLDGLSIGISPKF